MCLAVTEGMLASIAQFLAAHAIAMFSLSIGLRSDTRILEEMRARKRLLGRALLACWIVVPLFAMAILLILRPPHLAAAGLMVLAICPGVPLAIRTAGKRDGDATTSLIVLVATVVTAFVMIPLWSALLAHLTPVDVSIGALSVGLVLFPQLLLPLLIGLLIRELAPSFSKKLGVVANALFIAGLVIIAIVLVPKSIKMLVDMSGYAILAAACIPIGGAAIGYIAGRPRRPDQISVAYAAGMGNPAMAVAVLAAASLPKAEMLPLLIAFVLIRVVGLLLFQLWLRHQHRATISGELPASV